MQLTLLQITALHKTPEFTYMCIYLAFLLVLLFYKDTESSCGKCSFVGDLAEN